MTQYSGVTEPPSHGGFIASIEGMRALAVLAVLLFHLDIVAFAGGYLGVDLFFVISGFIITRNILSDLHLRTFSLKEFYLRRFRRLFPALLVTIVATLALSMVVLPPVELMNTARSAIFALVSLANINFWLESGYFDAAADAKPLLHTWSLSVEEQFYLLWPALLLALATTRRRIAVVLVLLALSLIAALWWRNSIPSGVFYLLPFRLHQLMAGAVLAILSLQVSSAPATLYTLLGTALFVAATMIIGSDFSPAVGAVVVSGCGFLLLAGRDAPLSRVLFANRPMMWIGRRSYAIYLVHWPIIVLFKFQQGFELNPGARLVLFVVSMLAAAGLHELVEKPFRKRGKDVTRVQRLAMPLTLITTVAVMLFAAVLWWHQGFPTRIDPDIQRVVASVDEATSERRRAIRFGQCNLHKVHKFAAYDPDKCASIDPQRKNVLIIGDSMAADIYMMLSQVYPDIHFLQATAGACTAVLDIDDIGGKYPTCEEFNEYRFSQVIKREVDLVILASIWNEDRIRPLADTVQYLHSMGKNVLVIGPRAHFKGAVPLQISKRQSLEGVNAAVTRTVVRHNQLLEQMRAAMPEETIVDISRIQCEPQCEVLAENQLLYIDERHFSKWGGKRIGERFRESFDLPRYIEAITSVQD